MGFGKPLQIKTAKLTLSRAAIKPSRSGMLIHETIDLEALQNYTELNIPPLPLTAYYSRILSIAYQVNSKNNAQKELERSNKRANDRAKIAGAF